MTKKVNPYDIERQAHSEPVNIAIATKAPNKWRFCDLETNTVYKWDEQRKEMVIDQLPYTFPGFGDKYHIMNHAREFTIEADKFFEAYNKVFQYDHNKPVDVIQLGMEITKALDAFHKALILWKLQLDGWYKGKVVEQMLSEHKDK